MCAARKRAEMDDPKLRTDPAFVELATSGLGAAGGEDRKVTGKPPARSKTWSKPGPNSNSSTRTRTTGANSTRTTRTMTKRTELASGRWNGPATSRPPSANARRPVGRKPKAADAAAGD